MMMMVNCFFIDEENVITVMSLAFLKLACAELRNSGILWFSTRQGIYIT